MATSTYWSKLSPEERTAEMKRRYLKGRRKLKKKGKVKRVNKPKHRTNEGTKERVNAKSGVDNHIAYLYGKVETILEHYAHSNGVPFTTLAHGVARLLQHPASR